MEAWTFGEWRRLERFDIYEGSLRGLEDQSFGRNGSGRRRVGRCVDGGRGVHDLDDGVMAADRPVGDSLALVEYLHVWPFSS